MAVTGKIGERPVDRDDLVDAVLGASRALVAVAARSLADLAEDVTLAQYRALVELAARGPQRPADLAARWGWIVRRPRGCAIASCASSLCSGGGSARIAAGCASR